MQLGDTLCPSSIILGLGVLAVAGTGITLCSGSIVIGISIGVVGLGRAIPFNHCLVKFGDT